MRPPAFAYCRISYVTINPKGEPTTTVVDQAALIAVVVEQIIVCAQVGPQEEHTLY